MTDINKTIAECERLENFAQIHCPAILNVAPTMKPLMPCGTCEACKNAAYLRALPALLRALESVPDRRNFTHSDYYNTEVDLWMNGPRREALAALPSADE